ncbi:MAG: histidine kinase [Rhodobacteraceae bacterium]|nr:histidine kinase [Paracoccaceae bacterium]
MIEWSTVENLKAEIGAEDFGDVVEVFLEEVEEKLAGLGQTPPEDLGAAFHFLKGSALYLGFKSMSDHCGAAEAAAKAGNIDQIDIPRTAEIYAQSKTAFQSGMAQRAAS